MSRSGRRLCRHAILEFVRVIVRRRDRFYKLKNRATVIREEQRLLFGQYQSAVGQKEVTADEHAGRILEWAMQPRPQFFSGVSGEQVSDCNYNCTSTHRRSQKLQMLRSSFQSALRRFRQQPRRSASLSWICQTLCAPWCAMIDACAPVSNMAVTRLPFTRTLDWIRGWIGSSRSSSANE